MKAFWVIPVALSFGLVVASESAAQFGRPSFVPRFSPPPRFTPPPRFVPHVPVTPHPNPGVPRTPTLDGRRWRNDDRIIVASFPLEAIEATTTVGLLGSPMGQGPLLSAAMLSVEGDVPWTMSNPFSHPVLPSKPNLAPPVNNADSSGPGSVLFWVLAVVGIGGLLIGIAKAINGNQTVTTARARVRIVSTPPGEAPREIREAWIGLELPVVSGQSNQGVFGVLSQHMAGSCDGYAVNGAEAVKLLASKDRTAAQWWRNNAPHVLSNDYQLVFPTEVCDAVG